MSERANAFRFFSLGLVGFPLGHSLSPRLHQAALQSLGLEGEYRLYPVDPADEGERKLGALIERLRRDELQGLNVTIPHKQNVIPFLDQLTPGAGVIGAVNTIYMDQGNLTGDNTDAPGFLADLNQHFPELSKQPRNALVLGAGGAARAVVYALVHSGFTVTVAARRLEQAGELADSLEKNQPHPLNVLSLEKNALAAWLKGNDSLDLLVNATPCGMIPLVEVSPWPADLALPGMACVYDLVYNPVETSLVRSARLAGLKAETGLGMLAEQAALAFERWTGQRPSRQAMHAAVK